MKTTVQALKDIYVKLGGDLSDTYSDIADGVPVSQYSAIPNALAAINSVIEGGGGGGGGGGGENIVVDFLISGTTTFGTEVTGTRIGGPTYSEAYLAMLNGARIFARLCDGDNKHPYAFFPLKNDGMFNAFVRYSFQQTINGVNAYYLHADYFTWTQDSAENDVVKMVLQDANHLLKFGVS